MFNVSAEIQYRLAINEIISEENENANRLKETSNILPKIIGKLPLNNTIPSKIKDYTKRKDIDQE